MAYVEGTTLVDGVLEVTEIFGAEEADKLEAWILHEKEVALSHPNQVTEIFLAEHDHTLGVECECVQYLTDHHPYWEHVPVKIFGGI